MTFRYRSILCIYLLCLWQIKGTLHSFEAERSIVRVAVLTSPYTQYSLINSVDFHPGKNLFCVTYTQGNRVDLYKINALNELEMVQSLGNPMAILSEPQHAVFSPDGEKMVVVNWTNQTFTIHNCEKSVLFCEKPIAVIPPVSALANYKPHGISISPCGNFLAIAYGAASYYGRAIALFRITKEWTHFELVSVVQDENLPGIPKGITFSPDGTCLLVTFSDVNSLAIFDVDKKNHKILVPPRQVIQGKETRISRPEDIKISSKGTYCAISNSDQHTVTFYSFDKSLNLITQNTPSYVLQNPEAHLCFPHGLAFSADGSFLLITEFGPISTTPDGNIAWDGKMRPDLAKVGLYKIHQMNQNK